MYQKRIKFFFIRKFMGFQKFSTPTSHRFVFTAKSLDEAFYIQKQCTLLYSLNQHISCQAMIVLSENLSVVIFSLAAVVTAPINLCTPPEFCRRRIVACLGVINMLNINLLQIRCFVSYYQLAFYDKMWFGKNSIFIHFLFIILDSYKNFFFIAV